MSKDLLSLFHRVNQIANESFATINSHMTARQVQVLAAVEMHEGVSQTRIVEITGVDRSTLAIMMARLQKTRLIERRRSKADARTYVLKLSKDGREALARGKPAIKTVENKLLASLSERDRAVLLELLEKVLEAHETGERA